MKKNKSYALKTGNDGMKRLELLNELCNPHTLHFIENIGNFDFN